MLTSLINLHLTNHKQHTITGSCDTIELQLRQVHICVKRASNMCTKRGLECVYLIGDDMIGRQYTNE